LEVSNQWQLFYLAASLTRARRLEAQRESFHAELYDCIVYSTVHYDREFMCSGVSPATDIQAFRIIESKDRYEELIQKEYRLSEDWQKLLKPFNDGERILIARHFQKKKPIPHHIINRLLRRLERLLDVRERHIDKQRSKQATEAHTLHKKHAEAFEVVLPTTKDYLIGGDFMKLSEDTYKNYVKRTGKVAEFIM